MRILIAIFFTTIQLSVQAQLKEVNLFGSNPGNLSCYLYVPKNLTSQQAIPLVVALHGCTQNALEIATETGWNDLADKFGFIVLYPEQKRVNNASACFNWFSKSDIRFNGESKSIFQMIEFVKTNYSIDKNRVFTYGLSAGAAMSTALLAQYPETFKSGAVLAGGPYGIALNGIQAIGVMKDGRASFETTEEWAKPVNDLHLKNKIYPSLIVMHGEDDKTVDPINSRNLVSQWIGLHPEINQDSFPVLEKINESIYIENYRDSSTKETIVKLYIIPNLGHQLPVDPGTEVNQGGQVGKYAKDIDFFSTYYIAKDFGIIPKE